MIIEVISVPGCPHHAAALEALQRAQKALGMRHPVTEVWVDSPAEAAARHLAGSPTVRINGRPVEPLTEGLLACRLAPPSVATLEHALRTAHSEEGRRP